MTGAAFLDFDKTIIHGDAGPHFGWWLFQRRRRKAQNRHPRMSRAIKAGMTAQIAPFVSWMAVQSALYKVNAMRRSTIVQNAYRGLKGTPIAPLDELMERFVEEHVRDIIYPQIRKEISEHLDAGRRVVIITTGMERLVQKVLPFLPEGIELIGCRLEEQNGRLTGRVVSGPLYGADKANIIHAYCQAAEIDLADCVAYTDHYSDKHMLEAVGEGVCINPYPRLRRLARRNNWRILDLPDPREEEREEEVEAA